MDDSGASGAVAVLVLILLPLVALLLWGTISPKSQWQSLQAWRYRDPEANEPSDTAYAMTRVGSVLGLVGLLVVGLIFGGTYYQHRAQAKAEAELEEVWEGSPRQVIVEEAVEQVPASSYDEVPGETLNLRAHDAVGADTAYLSQLKEVPRGTDLLVSFEDLPLVRVKTVVVDESARSVTVKLMGVCDDTGWNTGCGEALPGGGDGRAPGVGPSLVPIDLDKPLGDRKVVDGSTGKAVPPAGSS